MDTQPQSKFCPFKSRQVQDLASVDPHKKPRRKNRRRRKKNRKFGKELQNRGDLVYVRKPHEKKEQSTADTDKQLSNKNTTLDKQVKQVHIKQTKNVHSKFNPLLSEEFVRAKPQPKVDTVKTEIKEAITQAESKRDTVRRNPQNVEAYQERIMAYLLKKDKQRRVPGDYLERMEFLNEKRRGVLVDWLVNVSLKFKVLDETLFSAIWIMDRFFSKDASVGKDHLQLICITCLMISAKMEEVYPPSMADYVDICDGAYTQIEILDMEAHVLSVLQFDIAVATSLHLFRFFCRDLDISRKSFFFGEFLLHTILLDVKGFRFTQNEISAAAIFLVNKMFKEKIKWDPQLSELTGVSEKKVKVTAKELYKIFKKVNSKTWKAVKDKYSRVEVMEVAKFKVERVSRTAKS
jgi:hypothetical protein